MKVPPNREVALFSAALELPASERAGYLAQACADDPALRQRLEELLRVHEAAITFLENKPPGTPGLPNGAASPSPTVRLPVSPAEKVGDRIGRYKLLQQIGEGGCGVVYMADQETPVRRRVALKVIKLGMDTKQVIARFEAERQALALMDHPNIAKVFDAGSTDAGRPYFVMELVHGTRITDYCDDHNLATEERLKLFSQVCQAIRHAHQKGIIHRDIKPSNILVTVNEPGGPGCPKVIDFGIAKATTGQQLTNKTLFTAFEQFMGTPAYMSPEQATLTGLDIDTRTDIYALGVLLYELLTGVTPFDAETLRHAALDEIRRLIRETEPPKPSTRLHHLVAADERRLKSKAESRKPKAEIDRASARRLLQMKERIRLVQGDLDWIVMKCLEKDRARRYETANGLAMDVQRHLNCEPVTARPPSRLYEFQKTVRRHKFGFAAAGAVMAALVLGMVGSALEAARAKHAERDQTQMRLQAEASRRRSETEAAKATAISDFLQQMLRSANPDALKGSEYTVRQMLDDFAAGLDKQLADQPEVEAAVRATIGKAYYRLDVLDKAELHLARAVELRRRLNGEQSLEFAQSRVDHAWNVAGHGRQAEAEAEVKQALEIYRRRGADAQPLIHALCALGVFLNLQQKFAEAELVAEEALTLARKASGRDFPEVANVLHNLADTKVSQRKYAEAEKVALQAVEMHRRLHGPGHPETAWSLLMLGRALAGQHKLPEAEHAYREALMIFSKYYSYQQNTAQLAARELGEVLQSEGDLPALEALHREVLASQRAALGNDSPQVAGALLNLAVGLFPEEKQGEAEQVPHRADFFAGQGRWKDALRDAVMAVELQPQEPDNYHRLAALQVQAGDVNGYRTTCWLEVAQFPQTQDPNTAERLAKDCLLLRDSGVDLKVISGWADTAVTAGKDSVDLPWFQLCKGLSEYRQGHFATAAEQISELLAHAGGNLEREAEAYLVLAMAQCRCKKAAEARAAYAKGAEITEGRLAKLESGKLGNWVDWIVAHALLSEARTLVESQSAASKE